MGADKKRPLPKKDFTTAEAAAVWLAHEGICALCETPITDLRSNTVDHVLPENLQNKPEEFAQVRRLYNLPEEYNLNDFENWVAAHPKCNSRKGQTICEGPQAMGMILRRAKKGEKARRIHRQMTEEKDFALVVGQLDTQIKKNAAPIEQLTVLRALLEKAEQLAPLEAQLLIDPSRWKVIVIKPWGLAVVSDGEVTGETPVRTAPEEMKERWQCDHCKGYGPWDLEYEAQVFHCLNCGNRFGGKHGPLD